MASREPASPGTFQPATHSQGNELRSVGGSGAPSPGRPRLSCTSSVISWSFGDWVFRGRPSTTARRTSRASARSSGRCGEGDLAGAAEIAPVWGVALSLSMGLAATCAVVFAMLLPVCKVEGAPPAWCRSGISPTSAFRPPCSCLVLPLFGASVNAGCDECWLRADLPAFPLAVWALPGLVSLVWGGIFLWKYFPRRAPVGSGDGGCPGYGVRGGGLGRIPGAAGSFRSPRSSGPTVRFGGVP